MKKYNFPFNINHKFQLVSFFLFVSFLFSYAQDDGGDGFDDFGQQSFQSQKIVIPPAPNAASLGRFGEYGVSNYTGALNLSIPIYTLQGRGISHSVSLSYNGSGSRVKDVPSWTGLGWNLNAGGVITRSVRGGPDLEDNYHQKGGFNPVICSGGLGSEFDCNDNGGLNLATHNQILDEINTGLWDIKPDVYSLSVNGVSATFIIPPNTTNNPLPVVMKEDNGLSIFPYQSGGNITYFEVKDQNGFIYIFDVIEETTIESSLDDTEGNNIFPPATYNSSWYLSSIVSPTTNERLEFSYKTTNDPLPYELPYNYDEYDTYTVIPQTINSECNSNGDSNFSSATPIPIKIRKRRFLTEIKLKLGSQIQEKLTFDSNEHGHNPDLIDLKLNHISLLDRSDNRLLKWVLSYPTTLCNSFNRLMLSSVQEFGENDSTSKPAYSFDYYSGALPAFDSNAMDHWGFYNGADNNPHLIPNINEPGVNLNILGGAANRHPSFNRTRHGVMKSIIYPTGGYTEFEYELNQIDDADGFVIDPGGLRVRRAKNKNADDSIIDQKLYRYYEGVQFSRLKYYTETTRIRYPICCLDCDNSMSNCTAYTIAGSSNIPIQTVQGSHVGYSRVEEILLDENGVSSIGKNISYYVNGTVSPTNYLGTIEHGNLSQVEIKDHNGDVVKSTINNYDLVNSNIGYVINGFRPSRCQSTNRKTLCEENGVCTMVFANTLSTDPCVPGTCTNARNLKAVYVFDNAQLASQKKYQLVNTSITENFINNGTTNSVSQNMSFVYGDPHVTSPTQMTLQGPGVDYTTIVKYASEFPGLILDDLHMYSSIIETKKYANGGSLVGGTFVEYLGGTKPRKFRHILSDNSEFVMAEVLGYDANGFPEGYQRYPSDDTDFLHPETYTWENGNIKTITVANQTQIFNYKDDWKQVQSIIAADGTRTYYEYDPLQRLKITRSKYDSSISSPKEKEKYRVVTTNQYDYAPNKITSTTDFTGDNTPSQTSFQTFDGIGRPLTTVVNGIVKNEVQYDDYGRVEFQTYLPGSFKELRYQPNPLGRVEQEIYPDNSSISLIYDAEGGYKNTVIDENGHPSISVTDILGRTIRVEDALGNNTYYDYDYKGNLTKVKPPNFTEVGEAYEYSYDNRNRLIEKIIPGGATHTYQYNEADMMVGANNGNGNIVTRYDPFGRPVETGFGSYSESNNTYNITDYLTETFYDDPILVSSFPNNSKSNSSKCSNTASLGKVVGTKVKILEEGGWIYTTTCYDQYGRSIVTNSNNHLDGNDKVTSDLNLADLPTSIEREHNVLGIPTTEIFESFTYDGLLRNQSTSHRIGDLPENQMTLNFNTYNGADQLTGKSIGAHPSEGIDFLQEIGYKYNARGWLTHINEVGSTPGNEAIEACNEVIDCPDECTYISLVDFAEGVKIPNYINDITYIKWNVPFSIPLDYPYLVNINLVESGAELNRLQDDLNAWLNTEAYPAESIQFSTFNGQLKISVNQTKTEFDKIYTTLGLVGQPTIGIPWEQECLSPPDICKECYEIYKTCPCPLLFTEITPTKIRVEYDHPALTGTDIQPSLLRITETGIYTNMEGTTFSADKTSVRAVRSINTDGDLDAALGLEEEVPLTGDYTHVMEIDLQNNDAVDFNSFKSQVGTMLANEINSAGISSLATAEMEATIMEATAETWYEEILIIPSASGNSSANNPPLFAMELVYGNVHEMVDALPQHNGNISGMIWKTAGRTAQSYSFLYDDINRLIDGRHQEDVGEDEYVQNNYNVKLTYDNMGNIQTLFRNGVIDRGICPDDPTMNGYTFGRMDSLEYSYRNTTTGDLTNRLQQVDEYANTNYGYKGAGGGYDYDGNGNITRDHNKGVSIAYNHLNLPKSFIFDAGGSITITYDAAGIKLKKEVQGTENYTLHYIGGIEYRKETEIKIESIHHAEGRVTYDENDEAVYEYHLKDHLGNVRISFADKDGDGYIEPFNVNPNEPNNGTGGEGATWNLTDTEILQES
ncbi:MAG: hypothetical protein AB8H03_12120, partial [Saprospiraceae bacterium]